MGIPADWAQTDQWLSRKIKIFFPTLEQPTLPNKKCPDIPTLPSYQYPPPATFWKSFPFNPLPEVPTSPIDAEKLAEIAATVQHKLTAAQEHRAAQALKILRCGVNAPLHTELPGITVPNAISVTNYGEIFTDTLADWIHKRFVAGPFPVPPIPGFRSNAMMAVAQKGKIRIVMDMSRPEGESFNDAVDEIQLEKVTMSSAKLFGYSVIECGKGARMWKWDWDNAYKNCPASSTDLRLQGFRWMGCYFVETQQVFGSKVAVSAFDVVGHTLADLAAAASNFPPSLMHRTLDDLPIVTPASATYGDEFAATYTNMAACIGAKLAKDCPNLEKAFSNSTRGTVLGVCFDTVAQQWSISLPKMNKILARIRGPMLGEPATLNEIEKLLGSLTDLAQLCPFMKAFKHPLLMLLTSFLGDTFGTKIPSPDVRKDLAVWAAAAAAAGVGLPIPHRPLLSSPEELIFVSDAAGAQFQKLGDHFVPIPPSGFRGAASINSLTDGAVWFYAQVVWPRFFLLEARDGLGHAYGCKSSTLEAVGLLLPFLCIPELLAGRDILLLTDNISLVFGWEARRVNNDIAASVFIKALHLISCFLGCNTRVRHIPRMSTPSASLADALTRESSTTREVLTAVADAPVYQAPAVLLAWLEAPCEDWDLAYRLLREVQNRI